VGILKNKPIRLTLTNAPAPTSKPLEAIYYTQPSHICDAISKTLNL
jgi:pyruvate/2-oxoglutarate/acetoin dehydrogenase E1 component